MRAKIDESFISSLNISVHKSEHVFLDSSWVYKNARSPYTRLYFVQDGSGMLTYCDKTVKLQPGKVYMIPADLEFSYSCEYLEKVFFHVSILNREGYDVLSGIDEILCMDYERSDIVGVEKALLEQDCYTGLIIMSTVLDFLIRFKQHFCLSLSEIKTYSNLVAKIIDQVQSKPMITLKIKELALANYVSESKLRNLFLKEMGVTLGKYIDDMVFMEAKRLLTDRSIPMAEIARTLDFCDQFYFSKRFREKFGVTPTQFRKAIS